MRSFQQFFRDYVNSKGNKDPTLAHIADGVLYRFKRFYPLDVKGIEESLAELMDCLLAGEEIPYNRDLVLVDYLSLSNEVEIDYNVLLFDKADVLSLEAISAWDRIKSEYGREPETGEISAFTLSLSVLDCNLLFKEKIPESRLIGTSNYEILWEAQVISTESPYFLIETVLLDCLAAKHVGCTFSKGPGEFIHTPLPLSFKYIPAVEPQREEFETYHHLYKSLRRVGEQVSR